MQMPLEYTTVRQPQGSKLCGLAVCAIATDNDFEYIFQDVQPMMVEGENPYLSSFLNIVEYLAKYGIHAGWSLEPANADLEYGIALDLTVELDLTAVPCVVSVASSNFIGGYHWVFWDHKKRKIRDPANYEDDLVDREAYIIDHVVPLTYYSM